MAPVQESARATPHVQSLARGLAVVRAFDAAHPELTLAGVARRTGLTRAAARRFLLTLADLGYVRTDGRLFALTPRVLQLGYSYLSSSSLPELAGPHLEWLSAQVHESCSASVLDGADIVYVARCAVSRIMTVAINVGTRFPAHATSMGHVLLAGLGDDELDGYLAAADLEPFTGHTVTDPGALRAELARVAGRGWALVDQELEEGLRSVAAPVRDGGGAVVAAVNVSTHASRCGADEVRERLVPPLRTAAGRIGADLAALPPAARRPG